MIGQVIELLQSMDFKPTTENILIAKGGYRYPRTFKETIRTAVLWLKYKTK
jgi:hypothetical protein